MPQRYVRNTLPRDATPSHSTDCMTDTNSVANRRSQIVSLTVWVAAMRVVAAALINGSCALSVQANRRTPFANRRMKFYPRTITETLRARLKRNSLAATRPGVRKDRLSRDVIIIIIVHPFASRDLVFATNQGAVAPIRERSLPLIKRAT